ncbi:MAG: hypothetical protein ACFFHV_01295 [Promethearchaeota archaeon]
MKILPEKLKQWRKRNADTFEEVYKISDYSCLFHDLNELKNFTNTDDDSFIEY